MNDAKLSQAFELLEAALQELESEPENRLRLAALAKAFESTFEYVWKAFKRQADEAGLETYSPRDALKAAAQLGTIADLDHWNRFLNARNLSVHDYIGMDDGDTVSLVQEFTDEVRKLLS